MTIELRNFIAGLAAVLTLSPACAVAQQTTTDDLKREIQALAESVRLLQTEVLEIKTLLQNRERGSLPPVVVLRLANHPSRGSRTARVTLVEVTDYQCSFCSRYNRETFPLIDKEYIDSGKVRYVLMDLPLESIHPFAFKAAVAARCAAEQGKYWEMHDRLFANQQSLGDWKAHAQAVRLDVTMFDECLGSGRYDALIREDMAAAQKAGVTGTPAFLLAYTDSASAAVTTVARLTGAQPYSSFKAAIDRLLAAPK